MPQETWRDLLGRLIETPGERVRLARELGVHEWTPWRWVEGISTPRARYLKQLPALFPSQRVELLRLLQKDYPQLFPQEDKPEDEPLAQIPSVYYSRILSAYTQEIPIARGAILYLGLRQLTTQLALPKGATVFVMGFSPQAHSLHALGSLDPSHSIQSRMYVTEQLIFAGSESVAGRAVTDRKTREVEDQIALPLTRGGKVAGCLWLRGVSNAEWSQTRRHLLRLYADLLSLMFEDEQFLSSFELIPIPSEQAQQALFKQHQMRLVTKPLLDELEQILLMKGDTYEP